MSLAATTRLALALTALAAAALPAGASAATVDYTAAGRLAFAAAPGEANAITIAYDDVADPAHPVIVRDALLALTTSQPGCVAGATPNEVRCAATDPDPEFDLGDGDDTFDVDASVPVGPLTFRVNGGDGADRLTGGPRADVLVGGAGIDTLTGGRGDDILDARGADDAGGETLDGSAGNDTLIAGTGSDVLTGGAGDDLFSGDDDFVVTDFHAGNGSGDRIDLRAVAGVDDFGDVLANAHNVFGGVVLDFGVDEIALLGVSAGQLTAGDFLI